ncbi:MAG: iron-containing alcohol dehydrogenase [Oscillospiraceae bacterium]|jgi:alcohol dehydrogenase class IV|nr:iron-containing alcohol dehydrogenase [Oscillospiraceae bacterium]
MASKIWCRTFQLVMRAAVAFLDWTPPERIEGAGSVKELPKRIAADGLKKVLLVTDKGLTGLGLYNGLLEAFGERGIGAVLFDDVQPNPTVGNIEAGLALYRSESCQGIVAFGGGSPMDCAKGIGACLARPGKSILKMRGTLKVMKKIPPLYAIPTTAGTGSECTVAAVVSDPATHEKGAVNDPVLRPRVAVLDPELTLGLPPHITSTTGMDALTHAVEAYIGQSNTKDTIRWAEEAAQLIFANLETVFTDGKNVAARADMLLASHLAGLAFTRAYVGYVHSIAHNMGGMYGTPHGLANAIILPHVLEDYSSAIYAPLARLYDAAGLSGAADEETKAKAFITEIRAMNARMNIPEKIADLREEDIPLIAKRALLEGNPLYPVPVIWDQAHCESVIRKLLP